jgi:hypothetical protein
MVDFEQSLSLRRAGFERRNNFEKANSAGAFHNGNPA